MTTSVLVVDDQELVRTGLGMILDATDDLIMADQAADGLAAVSAALALRPDVVLMDVRMPGPDGIGATRQIVAETTAKVLVLTTFDHDEYVFAAFRAGAAGFLLKDAPRDQIVAGIRAVAGGEALASPSVTRRLIERLADAPGPAPRPPRELEELTAREREVLEGMARGLSNAELADRFVLSEKTVKTHVSRVLMKLGLRDRVQVVILAYEAGIVVPGRD